MKGHKKLALIALSLMMVVTPGCSAKVKNKYNIEAKALEGSVYRISAANNKLALKMLDTTLNSGKGENSVFSPVSLSTALSITQNGAGGKTKEEMLKALEMTGLSDADINEQYKAAIANFNSIEDIKIKMSNSIWVDKGTELKESFISTGKNYYETETGNVDFSKDEAANTINNWISDHTAGKIKKIVDKFEPDTALVLLNTVYFKGEWAEPFKKKDTSKKPFNNYNGSQNNVDMMHGDIGVDYLDGDGFSAIRMPYKDEDIGMYIFLPDQGTDIKDFVKTLSGTNWSSWVSKFSSSYMTVEMPKLHIEFEQDLKDMLKGFGMSTAFEPGADFSNLSPDNDLYISYVKQKCYLDVDEKSTEAIAITGIGMAKSAPAPAQLPVFTADRPFVYVIEDKKSGLILFMGSLLNL